MVSAVRVEHTGTFNMSDTSEQWKLFTSDQRVIARLPGFDGMRASRWHRFIQFTFTMHMSPVKACCIDMRR